MSAPKNPKIALVCSDGGHLTEMMALLDVFGGSNRFFITYGGAMADDLRPAYFFDRFLKNPFKLAAVFARIFFIFLKERPDAVFSTGAELAIPAFFIGMLFGCRLAYLECSAQVRTPSLTGRVVYPITDLFMVQWEPLLEKYGPRAVWKGGLI